VAKVNKRKRRNRLVRVTDPRDGDNNVQFPGGKKTVIGTCSFSPVMMTYQIDADTPVQFTPNITGSGPYAWTATNLLDTTTDCPQTGVWYHLKVRAFQSASVFEDSPPIEFQRV
jgi:hypothetical protein